MRTPLLPVSLLLVLSTSLFGQQTPSANTLTAPKLTPIQNWFDIILTAPPGSLAMLLASTTDGPTPTKIGTLGIGFPFVIMVPVTMPDNGYLDFRAMALCNRLLPGFTLHMQFVSVGPGPQQYVLSNSTTMTFVDAGNCDEGQHITFTQDAYDGPCQDNNAACLLQTSFDTIFPTGIVLGNQLGANDPNPLSELFTTAGALQAFQPQGPSQSPFDQFALNPTDSVAGHLAGQLAIAKVNVAFDDAGLLDPYKITPNGVKVGDMICVLYVSNSLIGMKVRDVIALADKAVSQQIPMPYDIDGDGTTDISFSGLDWTLTNINGNYENGKGNNQVLANPISP